MKKPSLTQVMLGLLLLFIILIATVCSGGCAKYPQYPPTIIMPLTQQELKMQMLQEQLLKEQLLRERLRWVANRKGGGGGSE